MLAWFRSDVAILYELPRFDILKVTMFWFIAKKYTSNTSELPSQNIDDMPCPLRQPSPPFSSLFGWHCFAALSSIFHDCTQLALNLTGCQLFKVIAMLNG